MHNPHMPGLTDTGEMGGVYDDGYMSLIAPFVDTNKTSLRMEIIQGGMWDGDRNAWTIMMQFDNGCAWVLREKLAFKSGTVRVS